MFVHRVSARGRGAQKASLVRVAPVCEALPRRIHAMVRDGREGGGSGGGRACRRGDGGCVVRGIVVCRPGAAQVRMAAQVGMAAQVRMAAQVEADGAG